jgi:hypothetical protein
LPILAGPAMVPVGYGSYYLSNSSCLTNAAAGYNWNSTGYYPGGSRGAQTPASWSKSCARSELRELKSRGSARPWSMGNTSKPTRGFSLRKGRVWLYLLCCCRSGNA